MTRPFRFALQSTSFGERAEIVKQATTAEELGYDEFFTADHLGSPDPFLPLIVAAEVTTSVRVGPLVLNNEFHEPALLARTAASIDRLTGGRLVLGLGTGFNRAEHDAMGMELREPGPRVSRFEESVKALRELLDDGGSNMQGVHHQLAVEDLGVRPIQERVPILIGGNGRRVMEISGKYADIVQLTGMSHDHGGTLAPTNFSVASAAKRIGWLNEAAGSRQDQIERSALIQRSYIGPDVEQFLEPIAERFGATVADLRETPFLIAGSLHQVVDKLHRQRELLGISHFAIRDAEGCAPLVAALAGQ